MTMTPERDTELDLLRGAVILYIIIVVHTLALHTWMYVGMPVIFFLSGATNIGTRKGPREFYIARLSKILGAYWVYALLCCMFIIPMVIRDPGVAGGRTAFEVLTGWLNPFGARVAPGLLVSGYLWFIPVYLLVMAAMPAYISCFRRGGTVQKATPLILAGLLILLDLDGASPIFGPMYYLRSFVFYSLLTYLGFWYRDLRGWTGDTPRKAGIIISLMTILSLLLVTGTYSTDMQVNKFPPSLPYLLYGLIVIAAILVSIRPITKALSNRWWVKLLRRFSERSYTAYLYQSVGFIIPLWTMKTLGIWDSIRSVSPLYFGILIVSDVIFGLGAIRLMGRFEDTNPVTILVDRVRILRRRYQVPNT